MVAVGRVGAEQGCREVTSPGRCWQGWPRNLLPSPDPPHL